MPPIDTPTTMPPFSADEQQLRQCFSGRRVLLVEDNALNQRVTTDILKRVNLHTTIAANGAAAIHILQNDAHYELILMDVQMPVMDGLQATRIIRTMPPVKHLPILAMTAHYQINDINTCLNVGMSDYLSKPILPELLLEKLLYWLRQQSPVVAPAIQQSPPPAPIRWSNFPGSICALLAASAVIIPPFIVNTSACTMTCMPRMPPNCLTPLPSKTIPKSPASPTPLKAPPS